jgi:hypothetical protein
VRFELRPSPLLAAGIVAAHAAAAAAVCLVLAGGKGFALAAALLALGLAAAWSRALLRSPRSVRALELGGGEALFRLANGDTRAVSLATRRYVSRHLVALPYRAVGRPFGGTLLVTGGMLEAQQFRRLRIWALWNRLPSDRRAVAPKQLAA